LLIAAQISFILKSSYFAALKVTRSKQLPEGTKSTFTVCEAVEQLKNADLTGQEIRNFYNVKLCTIFV